MFQSEQGTHYCADYLTGNLLSATGDLLGVVIGDEGWSGDGTEAARGLSEESLTADTLAGVSLNVATLMAKPLTEPFMEGNYNSAIGTVGLPSSMQYVNFKNESLETPVHSLAFPLQAVSNDTANDIHSEDHGKMATSGSTPMPSRSLSRKARQKSKEFESWSNRKSVVLIARHNNNSLLVLFRRKTARSEILSPCPFTTVSRHRRFMVAEKLRALQELLPATLKANQDSVHSNRESILDNTLGYIKYLELQVKGHGHYYPHDKFFTEPLEEVFGELIEENQTAACRLLESKGLHTVPIGSVHALCGVE
ncbi:hypothetical protein Cgig2_003822 [Carnegiea gigantea]|uniref:BHLH domain-containing protein n=1 Tax=Carnegiea gigantea TaxID=171969 RepID=A0A9Q1KK69_9CARY|nr:hypothetical protein Cgig2_003822 [Carnegiea gigantea]